MYKERYCFIKKKRKCGKKGSGKAKGRDIPCASRTSQCLIRLAKVYAIEKEKESTNREIKAEFFHEI